MTQTSVKWRRPNERGTISSHCFNYSVRAVRDNGCRVRWVAQVNVSGSDDRVEWLGLGNDFFTASKAKAACVEYAKHNSV